MLPDYPHINFKTAWEIDSDTSFILGQCHAMIKAICALPIQPEYWESLLRVSITKGAQATTAIEGNTLTIEEIENIQNNIALPPSKENQEKEVGNIIDALNLLLNKVVKDGEDQVITPQLIKRFHGLIGKDLGDYINAIPGQFRTNNVTVSNYRAPDYQYVPELIERLTTWLGQEFNYPKQKFSEAVIEAIVIHIYIAWIHPFGDGNGRTARLLEFYILLRAGMPVIASHILSNHYNGTRTEYTLQISNATKTRSLDSFIAYAIQGLKDGLEDTLKTVQKSQIRTSWMFFVHEVFKSIKDNVSNKRKRDLVLNIPLDKEFTPEEITEVTPKIIKAYAKLSDRTIFRDLADMIDVMLIVKVGKKYKANVDLILKSQMPAKKENQDTFMEG